MTADNNDRLLVLMTSDDFSLEDALETVGLRGIPISNATPMDDFRGLAVPGGSDINPVFYGKGLTADIGPMAHRRDSIEFPLVSRAVELGVPVFGICRGHQMINVAMGGTLIKDLHKKGKSHSGPHGINVVGHKDSIVAACFPEKPPNSKYGHRVNSYHHQAVHVLGRDLRVTATAPDGVVEAIEGKDTPGYVVGVQFHPEMGVYGDLYAQRYWRPAVAMSGDDAEFEWDDSMQCFVSTKQRSRSVIVPRNMQDDAYYGEGAPHDSEYEGNIIDGAAEWQNRVNKLAAVDAAEEAVRASAAKGKVQSLGSNAAGGTAGAYHSGADDSRYLALFETYAEAVRKTARPWRLTFHADQER